MTRLPVVDDLLDVRVQADHLLVELGVVLDEDLRVPAGSDEDGLNTARDGGREDVGNLEADEEGKGENHGGKTTALVVLGLGNLEVDICEQGACVADKQSTEREHGANQAFL